VDPFFHDVHCMLRLPIPSAELNAGCNVTIALSLLTVVAGISATCYREGLSDGAAFQGLLVEYYPWDEESKDELEDTIPPHEAARALWRTFRNPLAHSLGMSFTKDSKKGRTYERRAYDVVINRNMAGATEDQIRALEDVASARPHMHSTIHIWDGVRMLSVEALYWGLRRMLYRLSKDQGQMLQVNKRLEDQLNARTSASTEISRPDGDV
jgi:hypothetical protein